MTTAANVSNKPGNLNILLVGVGGQGTILASNILADLGMKLGYDVKKAEVHGMSQRGGSVISHVRWAQEVFSPIIAKGSADVMVAFEKMEVVRYIANLRKDGLVVANDHAILPITVSVGASSYPKDELIRTSVSGVTDNMYWVDGLSIAEELGNSRTANVVLLGALSGLLDMKPDPWLEVMETRVPPKFIDINREAFTAGRKVAALEKSAN